MRRCNGSAVRTVHQLDVATRQQFLLTAGTLVDTGGPVLDGFNSVSAIEQSQRLAILQTAALVLVLAAPTSGYRRSCRMNRFLIGLMVVAMTERTMTRVAVVVAAAMTTSCPGDCGGGVIVMTVAYCTIVQPTVIGIHALFRIRLS